jgi:hypothetical protein
MRYRKFNSVSRDIALYMHKPRFELLSSLSILRVCLVWEKERKSHKSMNEFGLKSSISLFIGFPNYFSFLQTKHTIRMKFLATKLFDKKKMIIIWFLYSYKKKFKKKKLLTPNYHPFIIGLNSKLSLVDVHI